MSNIIRTLELRVNNERVLFANTREGFNVVAQAINLLSEKLDEVIRSHNDLKQRLEAIESVLPKKDAS